MQNAVYEQFTLPSKGLIYDEAINPIISLRSMTTIEEVQRLTQSDTPYKVMADIIENCMQEKPKIPVYKMCLGDYQYLLHKIRVVTYGSTYKVAIKCPNCGITSEQVINLDELPVLEYDLTTIEERRLTLPKSGKIITLRYQTPADLDMIAFKNKEYKKKVKSVLDFSIIFSTMSLIKDVDGRILNELELEDFVKKLPMADVNAIVNKAEELASKIGIDNSILVQCPECQYEYLAPFRITSEFFRPTNSK